MGKRFFNTAGPINPKDHYYVPHRFNDAKLIELVEQKKYFILHAPRQSGKTTGMRVFVDELNATGKYKALYVNVEPAQAARGNVVLGLATILGQIKLALIEKYGPSELAIALIDEVIQQPTERFTTLSEFLQNWTLHSPKPIILFIDEIDSLVGDTLISVLRQLRAGYTNRPHAFPQSVCMIGVRDVCDYRIWSDAEQMSILGGSAFNIKSDSLTLADFSLEQLRDLYLQHTRERGQLFTDEAIDYAFYLSQGQPWLTNALAYQACFVDVTDRLQPITKEVIERAKEALIKRRDTHIDSLLDKLREKRVRPIIEAIITGETDPGKIQQDDLQYVRDLGIIRPDKLDIANPIYREIIPRELTSVATELITQTAAPFIKGDGGLDMGALLNAFVEFYRENSPIWLERFDYKEAGPHLLLMAFLQRVINGGGTLLREYALGTRRVDILLKWRKQMIMQNVVIELKIRYDACSLPDGLKQTADYMDSSGADEGHLVLFDRDPKKSWQDKIFHLKEVVDGKIIQVWGC